jgi:hypothetical protein
VGAAIASLAIEGSGPFYVSETLPRLVESRTESLQAALKTV